MANQYGNLGSLAERVVTRRKHGSSGCSRGTSFEGRCYDDGEGGSSVIRHLGPPPALMKEWSSPTAPRAWVFALGISGFNFASTAANSEARILGPVGRVRCARCTGPLEPWHGPVFGSVS